MSDKPQVLDSKTTDTSRELRREVSILVDEHHDLVQKLTGFQLTEGTFRVYRSQKFNGYILEFIRK